MTTMYSSTTPANILTSIKGYFPKETQVFLAVMSAFHLVLYGYGMAVLRALFPTYFPKPRKDISGQTVLITGAGSGLGRQMAIEFSKRCGRLVLFDLNKDSLSVTESLLDETCESSSFTCDVSDRARVYEVAGRVKKEVGTVDIVVNNAGIVCGSKFLDIPDEMVERTMNVNMLSHFWMCKAFLPDMMSRNSGHIVCVASQAGLSGMPRLTDYCASKFGAVGLMESLVLELEAQGLDGVRTTTVCPSLISTGLFEGTRPPLTVLMTPEFVAGEVVAAVLEDQELLMLPRWSYLLILLKWTMPRVAIRRFYQNSGLLQFMDTFQGRQTNNNSDKKAL